MRVRGWIFRTVATCLIIASTAPTSGWASEPLARVRAETPTPFIESAVNMLVFFEVAIGNPEKAACFHKQYFGTPGATRFIVNTIWSYPAYPAEAVLIVLSNSLCAAGKEPPEDKPELWKYAVTPGIQAEKIDDVAVAIEASISTMSKKARVEKLFDIAQCVDEKLKVPDWTNQIRAKAQSSPRTTPAEATFNAVRDACGYPDKAVATDKMILPVSADLSVVVRERLLAVRDLQSCDKRVDDATRDTCVSQYARLRRLDIITKATLAENGEALQKTRDRVEAMRKAAWRLPDGRLIFQDDNRAWRFEDGSFVAPELAARRVPPPK